MSLYKTPIPVNVADVIAQLPERAYVDSVALNADRTHVDVVWGCDDLKTGYTFPVEYPLEKLLRPADDPPIDLAAAGLPTETEPPVNPPENSTPRRKGAKTPSK